MTQQVMPLLTILKLLGWSLVPMPLCSKQRHAVNLQSIEGNMHHPYDFLRLRFETLRCIKNAHSQHHSVHALRKALPLNGLCWAGGPHRRCCQAVPPCLRPAGGLARQSWTACAASAAAGAARWAHSLLQWQTLLTICVISLEGFDKDAARLVAVTDKAQVASKTEDDYPTVWGSNGQKR